MHKKVKGIIATALSTVMVLSLGNSVMTRTANAVESNIVEIQEMLQDREDKESQKDQNEVVRVIVQLHGDAAINTKESVQSIKAKQEPVQVRAMEITGAKEIVNSFGYLVNGFSLDVKRGDIEKLRNLPGVSHVAEANIYERDMTNAKSLTQAYDVWKDMGLKGEKTVVAVLDSGTDITHKDFKLTDPSSGRLKEADVKAIMADSKFQGKTGKYVSAKIPFVYNYAEKSDVVLESYAGAVMHGMHVAGIVGGNATEQDVKDNNGIQGVAPECQILGMRVFPNKEGGASEDSIVAAIEDSVLLGADVINMSLGSVAGFQDDEDLEQKAIAAASNAGVTVVVSAGNSSYSTGTRVVDCPDTGLSGAPGLAKAALQVASYENTKLTADALDIKIGGVAAGSIAYMTSDVHPVGALSGEYKLVDCGIGDVADFAGKDLKGKIALIKRGTIDFVAKKVNAQTAGAAGCIIFNRDGDNGYIHMATDAKITTPGIFVTNTDGVKLLGMIVQDATIKFNGSMLSIDNVNAGDMSDFTSWGPTPNLAFKPQITGPGGNIYSLANNNKYQTMGGTSMSAPHVAGSEALIAQSVANRIAAKTLSFANPREKVEFLKNTAIVTASPSMSKEHPEVPYSPRRQGAGMIQTENAIKNSVIITDVNGYSTVALKEVTKETTFKLTLKNYSNTEVTYGATTLGGVLTEANIAVATSGFANFPSDVNVAGSTIKFDNDTVVVPANGQKEVTVTITLPETLNKEQFIEGFLRFESKTAGAPSIGTPFVGFYGDWSKPQVIDKPIWDKQSVFKLGYLLSPIGNSYYVQGKAGSVYDTKTIAISPNGDACFDEIVPKLAFLRNAKEVTGEVVNAQGTVIRNLGKNKEIGKSVKADLTKYGAKALASVVWDGKDDKGAVVQEGQYTIKLISTIDYETAKPQYYSVDLPVKVDITNPEIKVTSPNVSIEAKYNLQWTATDNLAGIYGTPSVKLNGVDLKTAKPILKDGVYSLEIQLIDGKNAIEVSIMDNAMNMKDQKFEVTKGEVAPTNQLKITLKSKGIEGGFAKSTFTVENKTAAIKDVALIMAAYDKDNIFLDYVCVKKSMNVNEVAEFSGQVKLPLGTSKVKCFMWDSLESMVPLSSVEEIEVK
jgi:lactocepin